MASMTAVCTLNSLVIFVLFERLSYSAGRMFDKDGNIRQWWTNRTIEEYLNRTDCFVKQYSSYYMPEINKYVS